MQLGVETGANRVRDQQAMTSRSQHLHSLSKIRALSNYVVGHLRKLCPSTFGIHRGIISYLILIASVVQRSRKYTLIVLVPDMKLVLQLLLEV